MSENLIFYIVKSDNVFIENNSSGLSKTAKFSKNCIFLTLQTAKKAIKKLQAKDTKNILYKNFKIYEYNLIEGRLIYDYELSKRKNNPNFVDTLSKNNLGEKNPLSKLTEDNVIAIRKDYTAGTTQKELAKLYNVSVSTIWNIVNNKIWKHVQ